MQALLENPTNAIYLTVKTIKRNSVKYPSSKISNLLLSINGSSNYVIFNVKKSSWEYIFGGNQIE